MRRNLVFALITTALLSAAVAIELRGLKWGGDELAEGPPTAPEQVHQPDLAEGHLEPEELAPPKELAPPESPGAHETLAPPEDAALPATVRSLPTDREIPEGPRLADKLFVPVDTEDLSPRSPSSVDERSVLEKLSVGPPSPYAREETPSVINRLPPVDSQAPAQTPRPRDTNEPVDRTVTRPAPPVAPGDHWQALTDHALHGNDVPRYNTSVETIPPAPPETAREPQSDATWWAGLVPEVQREGSPSQKLDLATIVQETILHSEHIQAISLEPQIRETEITQADAAFDPAAFIESKWNDLSDPVGNLLTTGGPPRLSREEWTSSIGLRRKIRSGGRFEIAQRLTEEDNNSVFFVPPNQATSRLTVSLNQPLLKGGGKAYNRSLILLAQHDTQVARDRFDSELEQRVLEVVGAYWELYYQRAVLLQQQAALRQAQEIHASILARQAFDSLASQASRVQATVAIREAEVAGARAGVRNAETRLRQLTTSPLLGGPTAAIELLPVEPPLEQEVVLEPDDARELALANRSEIDEALTRVRAAGVQLGVAENEMLPSLGLVLETYLSGLEGNFDLSESFAEQFSAGAPSYTAGILFEIPLGRRAGFAFRDRKVLELRQAEHVMRQTVSNLSAEVEVALREVETTWDQYLARRAAAIATTDEVRQKRARLNLIPGEDHTAVSYNLEDVLNAIDRLVNDESALAEAQRNYAVAIAAFNRATGTLVNVETGGH